MINPRSTLLKPPPQQEHRGAKESKATRARVPLPRNTEAKMNAKPSSAPKHALLPNPEARATGVMLAGLDPAAGGTKQGSKNPVLSNKQARTTNIHLAGLDPAARSTQATRWEITQSTINAVRVTSTGTYVPLKVKDFSVQPKSSVLHHSSVQRQSRGHRQVSVASNIEEHSMQSNKKDSRTVIKATASGDPRTLHQSHARTQNPREKRTETQQDGNGTSRGIATTRRCSLHPAHKHQHTKHVPTGGHPTVNRRSLLPVDLNKNTGQVKQNAGNAITRGNLPNPRRSPFPTGKAQSNKAHAQHVSTANVSGNTTIHRGSALPVGKAQTNKTHTDHGGKVITSSDPAIARSTLLPADKARNTKRITHKAGKVVSHSAPADRNQGRPSGMQHVSNPGALPRSAPFADKTASQASSNSEAATVIGPIPANFPKRNKNNFSRKPVFGLFPGQKPEGMK